MAQKPSFQQIISVFCDFDGTIIQVDGTDAVLERFASPEWRDWEAAWVSGKVSTQQCLRHQTELLRVNPEALREFAVQLPLDRGIFTIDNECKARGIPFTIVSDGLDIVAQAILAHHGLSHVPVYANHVEWTEADRPTLSFPNRQDTCTSGAGTCKCAITDRAGTQANQIVYIGDGRSDFCVAGKGHRVFAKGALQSWCAEQKIAYESFDTLDQVAQRLFHQEALIS